MWGRTYGMTTVTPAELSPFPPSPPSPPSPPPPPPPPKRHVVAWVLGSLGIALCMCLVVIGAIAFMQAEEKKKKKQGGRNGYQAQLR